MGKKIISLEITDGLREALRTEAFKRDVTISALIRNILEKELNVATEAKETNNK